MFLIYDLLFLLTLIIYSPILLIKSIKKQELSFWKNRFGCLICKVESTQKPIWFHAASVGEVNGLYPIIDNILQKNKNLEFVITTYTVTGLKRAREVFSNYPVKCFSILPLDISCIMKRFIKKINPSVIVISETELWPNLIWQAKKHGVKILVVNGRISDRAWPKYSRFRFLFKHVVDELEFYCAQTEADKSRIISLGISNEKVKVCGNSKYSFVPKITKEVSINLSRPVITAGSTRPGEEEIIISAFKTYLDTNKKATLILGPRHLERVSEVEGIVKKADLFYVLKSRATGDKRQATVIILDTMGELNSFYKLSDLTFVGGTLAPFDGHNILEPAAFGKPVLFGPYVNNVKEVAADLEKAGGGRKVDSAKELGEAFLEILSDENMKNKMGENAFNVFLSHKQPAFNQAEIIGKYVYISEKSGILHLKDVK